MKKIHLIFIYLNLLICPARAWTACSSFELRAGYFCPSSSVFHTIYSDGMIEFEVEGSRQIANRTFVWANFSALEKEGYSTKMLYRTTLHLYPLSFGVKYQIPIFKSLFFHLGVGGSITWVSTHDRSTYVKQHLRKKAWGFVGKSSLAYLLSKSRFINIFVDYYDTDVSRSKGSLNIGGVRSGIGLGIII